MSKTPLDQHESWGLPPAAEGVRIIRNDALHHVRRRMGQFAIAETQGNALTIARGTPLQICIVRNNDNSLCIDPQNLGIPIRPGHPQAIAPLIALLIETTTENDIIQRLREIIGKPEGTLQGEIESFLRYPVITRAAQEAAREAAGPTVRNPGAQWNRALTTLAGAAEIRRTLRTFGRNATLGDIGIASHPAIRDARRISPNATLLWALRNEHRTCIPQPWSIIQNAQEDLNGEIRFLTIDTSTGPPHPELVWQTFLKLDQYALATCPCLHGFAMLTIMAIRNQTNPSRHAARAILGFPNGAGAIDPRIADAFLCEDSQASPERQREIALQLINTAAPPLHRTHGTISPRMRRFRDKAAIITAQEFLNGNDSLTWQQVEQDIPREPVTAPAARKRAISNRKSLTQQEALQILQGPTGQQFLQQITTTRVMQQPGAGAALIHQDQTLLGVTRSPGGFLQIHGNPAWTSGLHIPSPRGEDIQWSSRGTGMENALDAGMKTLMKSVGKDKSLSRKRAQAALVKFLDENVEDIDQSLSGRLLTSVKSLADPQAWHLAKEHAETVTPHRYNTAAGAIPHLQYLEDTNPGALAWALAYAEPNEEIRHPGQIIALARESIFKAGLNQRHWRYAATLPGKTVRTIARNAAPASAATVIGAIANARAIPSPTIINATLERMLHDEKATQKTRDSNNTVRMQMQIKISFAEWGNQEHRQRIETWQTNQERTLSMLFRESARLLLEEPGESAQQELTRQIPDIRDYLTAKAHIPITATTWRGLVRASQAWHREQLVRPSELRWQKILQQRGGRYLAWEPLVEPTEINGLTITPLASELDLYQESREMLHCVISYGSRCAAGSSIIVSLQEKGRSVATSELIPAPGGWAENQTRGKRNHPAHDDVVSTMRKFAATCRQIPAAPPRSWFINAETGEQAGPDQP